jgi:SulP family sulfate permease
MFVDAAVLGMLGCIDALLTAVIADSVTRTEHNSNKELVGQGLGNLVSGLFGGLPGAGATMGTVVNIQAGGRSALSGISRALILLVVILAFKDLASQIPQAVLAGIALKVGVDIVDWGFIKRAHRISLSGALIMYLVIALTVLVDLIVAVGVGVFIANVLTIDKMTALQAKSVKSVSTGDGDLLLPDDEKALLDQGRGQVLLFQLNGAMIFGVAKAIAREHNAIGECKAVIFDLSEVSHLGVTAALAVENAVEEAIEKGRQVFVVGAADTTRRRLEKLGLFAKLPSERTTLNRKQALQQAVAAINQPV